MYLWLTTNALAALLTLATSVVYLGLYTPLKRVSPICTFIGAFPGAMPPVLGWVAFRHRVDWEAILLFTILFLWQFPHFYSIAWILKKDYKLAGLKMSPLGADTEKNASIQIMLFSFVLVLASFVPWALGAFHLLTCSLLAVVNGFIAWRSIELYNERTNKAAKKLMLACLLFLPASSLVLLLEKVL
jgi:protoheme IX farnesyltransferase